METIRGTVANIRRDVKVVDPSYSDDHYNRGSTTDITNFELSGRPAQYRSGRATYNSISEGDELIVAGKSKGTVFQVIAFRNVTKSLNSYTSKSLPIFRMMAIATSVIGVGFAALLFLIGKSPMTLSIVIPFLGAAGLLFYWDYRHRDAVTSIENHR